jgi:hypothetical protein
MKSEEIKKKLGKFFSEDDRSSLEIYLRALDLIEESYIQGIKQGRKDLELEMMGE